MLEVPTEVVPVDLVVMAMGYRTDPEFEADLPGTPVRREVTGVPDRRWAASGILAAPAPNDRPSVGRLALGRETALWAAALPRRERVWTVGDALTGPATVVEAMAQGRRAAASVLDARPSRPAGPTRRRGGRGTRVLICHESAGGTTARVAEAIADGFAERGEQVRVLPIARVGAAELAAADLVVLGSWVEGFVVAGVRPAKAMRAWLATLPPLAAKPVGLFCTFGVSPRTVLRQMAAVVEASGGAVVGQAAFGPKDLEPGTGDNGPVAFGRALSGSARPIA